MKNKITKILIPLCSVTLSVLMVWWCITYLMYPCATELEVVLHALDVIDLSCDYKRK